MKKKLFEIPVTDVLGVRLKGGILSVSQNGFSSQGTEKMGYDPDEDL